MGSFVFGFSLLLTGSVRFESNSHNNNIVERIRILVNKKEREKEVGIEICGPESTKVFDGNQNRVAKVLSYTTCKKYSF